MSTRIYNELREKIINGELRANEMINERELADKFGVSRVPVREAFNRLCNEGYLIKYPQRGYLVNLITDERIKEIQAVRYQLESLAVVYAVKNCTDGEIGRLLELPNSTNQTNPYGTANTQFHKSLVELTGNRLLAESIYKLLGDASMAVFQRPQSSWKTYNCHKEIVEAMLERDLNKALKALARDMTFKEFLEYEAILPVF